MYQVQASRFIAQVIVLVIINAMIGLGNGQKLEKSIYRYFHIVKMENGVRVNAGLIIIIYWKPYATTCNNKISSS